MAQKKIDSFQQFVPWSPSPLQKYPALVYAIPFTIIGIVLLLDIVMPSHTFWLFNALLLHLTCLSFPMTNYPLFSLPRTILAHIPNVLPLTLMQTRKETFLFIGVFVLLFMLYFLAIRYLPRSISYSYIRFFTLLIGLAYVFIPIVTSQDIFSYIAYARMDTVYHLNPMITLPTAISHDPVYRFLYWTKQPSVYGPTWVVITSTLQWCAFALGFKSVLAIELLLRLLGLALHLGSTQLIWLMSEQRQYLKSGGPLLSYQMRQQRRLGAVLAFAWNPFLLLEACVNVHDDTAILLLVLLALWLLAARMPAIRRPHLPAAILLALAACLKITLVALLPGLLLFLWMRRSTQLRNRRGILDMATAVAIYAATILLLYAPFWQQGALLHTFQITPGTSRDINSPYEFLIRLYAYISGTHLTFDINHGSGIEVFTHQISLLLFTLVYAVICLRSLAAPRNIQTLPALIRWMALVWLLYCTIGSPWFWPWYAITFFGLSALVEADTRSNSSIQTVFGPLHSSHLSLFKYMLTISLMTTYSFGQWIPTGNAIPQLPDLQYLRGLWIWIAPLLILCFSSLRAGVQKYRERPEAGSEERSFQ